MAKKIPLNFSVDGRPIAVGTSLTSIHTVGNGLTDILHLEVFNSTVGVKVLTIDVDGVTSTLSFAGLAKRTLDIGLESGAVLQMSADVVGIEVLGWVERGRPGLDHKLALGGSTKGARIDVPVEPTKATVHTAAAGHTDLVTLNIVNTVSAVKVIKLQVDSTPELTIIVGVDSSSTISLAISDGAVLTARGTTADMHLYGHVERSRYVG